MFEMAWKRFEFVTPWNAWNIENATCQLVNIWVSKVRVASFRLVDEPSAVLSVPRMCLPSGSPPKECHIEEATINQLQRYRSLTHLWEGQWHIVPLCMSKYWSWIRSMNNHRHTRWHGIGDASSWQWSGRALWPACKIRFESIWCTSALWRFVF